MSREEHLRELVRQGQALRQEDIDLGAKQEQERVLAMKKDIINCVIDYGLTPEKYERICNDIDALIKGEK